MSQGQTQAVMQDMADNGGLDQELVSLVLRRFAELNDIRIAAQDRARRDFDDFYGE